MTPEQLARSRWTQYRAYLDTGFSEEQAMRLLLHDADLLTPLAAGGDCDETGHQPGDNLICEVCGFDLAKPS